MGFDRWLYFVGSYGGESLYLWHCIMTDYYCRMTFSMVVNHFGSFVNEPYLHYKGGEVHMYHGLDVDSWSFFKCVDLVK